MVTHVYKALVRPWLFQTDPEVAHERALNLAASLGRVPYCARHAVETVFAFEERRLRQTVFRNRVSQPVGLGGGLRQERAWTWNLWPALGFGLPRSAA
jgi:hypothetical protein